MCRAARAAGAARADRPARAGSRLRLYGADGALVDRQLAARPARPTSCAIPATQTWTKDVARALDRGFDALVGAEPLDDFVEPRDRPARGLARSASRRRASGRSTTAVRNAPDLTPVILRRRAGRRRRAAGHRQRPRLHPDRAQPARARSALAMALATILSRSCCRCSSPGPSSGRCAGWRSPRTGCGSAGRARSRCRACPRAATRSACSPARCQRHEPVAAPADRQYRGLRRRRHPRAQEPARLAALGGRRPRAGRGSRSCARSCSTSRATTSSGSTG